MCLPVTKECSYIPMTGIYGYEWVQGTAVVGQGTGTRQKAPLTVLVDRGYTPEQPKDSQKQDLAKRDMRVWFREFTGAHG